MALAANEVLVHDRLGEEAEAGYDLHSMARDRGILVPVVAGGVPRRGLIAGDHRVRHDRGAGGRPADHRAFPVATQHRPLHRTASQCRRDQRLVPAAEPDARGRVQPMGGRFQGGRGAVQMVDECPRAEAVQLGHKGTARLLRLRAGVRHHRDAGPAAAGQLDEPAHHRLRAITATHDHQRAARRIGGPWSGGDRADEAYRGQERNQPGAMVHGVCCLPIRSSGGSSRVAVRSGPPPPGPP